MQREETRKASHATTLETSLAQLALGEAKVRQAQEARDAIHAAIASRKRASSSANIAKPGLQDASHQEVAIEAGEAKQGAVAEGEKKLEAVDEAEGSGVTRFVSTRGFVLHFGDDGGPGRELKADCGREDITFSGML